MTERPPELVEEERLLEVVQANLARAQGPQRVADHAGKLRELRDSLADEKLVDDIASVMEEMNRTAALMAQQQQHQTTRVDAESPYFGHMVLEDTMGRRAILIGRQTFLSDRVRIVDWRNAPISRLFYQYAETDEYEEEIAGRLVTGEVKVRRTMTIHDGELRRVATDERTWVKDRSGTWRDASDRQAALAGGAGAAVRPASLGTDASSARRDKHLPEIASLLDPSQFQLITRPNTGVVVIQGSAGSGKTTVGLHRIAYLAFRNPQRFQPHRMMVLTFSRALTSYIDQVLPALGIDGVEVLQYEAWARRLRRQHFKGLPKAYADDTPAIVVRFKTHTAILKMVDEVAAARRGASARDVFEDVFTDLGWLTRGLTRWAPGEFSHDEIARIHRWCTDQHFARVDEDRDGRTPCLDPEDDTILLRLYQRLHGPLLTPRKRPLQYRHVMVDEAQDLSPLELAVVIDTAGREASVTLAGDVAQQVAERRDLREWTEVLDALDLAHLQVSPLQVSYRSTRQIMTAGRDILGSLAPDEPLVAPREGAPVAHLPFGSMGEAVTWIAPALHDLMRREPTAYAAVLAATPGHAAVWYEALDRAEIHGLRLVDDQNFAFRPGVEVSDIRSSKGLEFDYVILVGVDHDAFPAVDPSRHLLHVGATRAAHQLWFVSTGRPSPLIPDSLAGMER